MEDAAAEGRQTGLSRVRPFGSDDAGVVSFPANEEFIS